MSVCLLSFPVQFSRCGRLPSFLRTKGLKLCHCPANLQSDTVKEYSRTVDSSLAFFLRLFASPVCLPAFPRMSFASARPRSLRSASAPLCSFRPRVMLRLLAFAFLPRKEVIQPHLPIRLPCYDFYLVTTSPQSSVSPSTADPLRLSHRLRVLPTPMV